MRRRPGIVLLSALALSALALTACGGGGVPWAQQDLSEGATVSGQPRVIDGDTLELFPQGATYGQGPSIRVRLAEIDAPERHEPGGPEATARLRILVGGLVNCSLTGTRSFERYVAYCRNRWGKDLQAQMVLEGLARHDERFGDSYATHEKLARKARRGIWKP